MKIHIRLFYWIQGVMISVLLILMIIWRDPGMLIIIVPVLCFALLWWDSVRIRKKSIGE